MAIGTAFLVDLIVDIALDPRWLAPLVLIGVGIAGLLGSVPVRTPQVEADAAHDDAANDAPLAPR